MSTGSVFVKSVDHCIDILKWRASNNLIRASDNNPAFLFCLLQTSAGLVFHHLPGACVQSNGRYVSQKRQRWIVVAKPRQFRLGSRDNRCLIYARSIPLNAGCGNNGNILVLIDEKQLQHMMNGLQFEEGGWVSITDNEHNVLLNYAPGQADIHAVPAIDDQLGQDGENGPDSGFHEQDIEGRTMLVFRDRSPITDWLYTVAVSKVLS